MNGSAKRALSGDVTVEEFQRSWLRYYNDVLLEFSFCQSDVV
jgi:hypothetical protein